MFYGLETGSKSELKITSSLYCGIVLKRFLDMDHLISLLVQLPKQETVKSAENKITLVICIKHCLELVETLRGTISSSQNPLLSTFYKVNFA